ncbi:general stress protein [Virgibacillus xinjiangensis]|uniref:General stress protein n=1 Tax=Virgibacillus xinjiangensis TaxID=393090 RepID=A0ABV7CY50_9BACI
MSKHIQGSYRKQESAVEAVNKLKLEGYKPSQITVVTNSKKTEELKYETSVNLEEGTKEKKKDESLMDKVDRLFADETTNPLNQLRDLGVNEEEAKQHQGDMKSGLYLVLVDETQPK